MLNMSLTILWILYIAGSKSFNLNFLFVRRVVMNSKVNTVINIVMIKYLINREQIKYLINKTQINRRN